MVSTILLVTLPCLLCALLLHVGPAAAGSTYIRWGRTTCPAGARVLYKGYMAGSQFNQVGAGSNYLCVHEKPQWSKSNVPGVQAWSSLLYGTEYEIHAAGGFPNNKPFESDNARGADLANRDAVCVLCYVPNSSTNFMLPGRQDCGEDNDDLKLEYKGLLASNSVNWGDQHRSEFICIDEAPEARLGSEADLNGALLYPVQVACGSLPCPDYVNGNEVTCAVCSV